MDSFSNALKTWFHNHSAISLRNLSNEAGLTPIDVSRVRAGEKQITLTALTKLLPAIEKLSTRTEARSLLVAYLHDETPPDYTGDVRVYAIDESTGAMEKDVIAHTRDRWEARARSDATFATWWLTADGYMHEADTDAVDERAIKYQQERNTEIALVAEEAPEDNVTPLPTKHPAQKAVDDINAQFSQLKGDDVNKKKASEG
ncbi:hypothetical protein [Prosthecobacter sp.]|uniref:hypothetical protein n=1 Tax=Prosthecobacter sp. TaxID=1965333 RepID=UPI003785136A